MTLLASNLPAGLPLAIRARNEQRPLELIIPYEDGTLSTADYSMRGYETRIGLERKSLEDLIQSTCSGERPRFDRALTRLSTFERKLILVEADLEDVLQHRYRSRVEPKCIIGSIASFWGEYGIATVFSGSRRNSAILASAFLVKAWKYLSMPALPDEAA